jgi:hypothetical protein
MSGRSRPAAKERFAAALGVGALLALSPIASAQTAPTIDVHALFSGGKTSGFTVGTPLGIQYNDPSGQTREKQVCWSPAPIDVPACTPTGTGAPARAGTQQVTVQLTNGQSVSKSFAVGPAATQLGSGTANAPPVPYTVTCSTELYGDAGQDDPLHVLSPGEQVAAYYRANSSTVQVYDYSTNTAGFVAASCVTGPREQARTLERTVRLRSNRTQTYRLQLPQGFKAVSVRGSTPIAYQLYSGQRGSGVGNYIRAKGGGVHKPFLGATVIRDGFTSNAVFVRVRTTSLERPVTLLISAYGTTGARAADAATGKSCAQIEPVDGSTMVHPTTGVTLVKPPSSVPADTQLVVGARYLASTKYKSVYAFISSSRSGPAIGEQFFSGSGAKLRCANIGSKLKAGTTRYIQYQLVPRKQGGKRTKIFYKVTVES